MEVIENNSRGGELGENLLEEIAVAVRRTKRYVRAVAALLPFTFTLGVTFVMLEYMAVYRFSLSHIYLLIAVCIVCMILNITFMYMAGMKSHKLLKSCKRRIKSFSTIREMELIRLVTELRNLFFLGAIAYFLLVHVLWLITVFMINGVRANLQRRYLADRNAK